MKKIRVYEIYTEGEHLCTVTSIEDALDTVHTSLSEMMSGVEEELNLQIKVRAGEEESDSEFSVKVDFNGSG